MVLSLIEKNFRQCLTASAVAAPILFGLFLRLGFSLADPSRSVVPDANRYGPLIRVLPFITLSIFPLILTLLVGLVYTVTRPVKRAHDAASLITLLLLVPVFVHCFFTYAYARLNEEAYSNSVMIDIVVRPELLLDFVDLPDGYRLATNVSTWHEAYEGPHVDLDLKNLNYEEIGPRVMFRIMYHKLDMSHASAIQKLINGTDVVFNGVWVLVEREPTSLNGPPGRTKFFTEYAAGNTNFNSIVLPYFQVDNHNSFMQFKTDTNYPRVYFLSNGADIHQSHPNNEIILDSSIPDLNNPLPKTRFLQDQYSAMDQADWLEKITGKRWCFYKVMHAETAYPLAGTISHPLLKETHRPVQFPIGDPNNLANEDIWVRGVTTRSLHWTRDNYYC